MGLVAGLLTGLPLMAKVEVSPFFSDDGILQREQKVAVWGWADAGEKVEVSFSGQKKEVTTGGDGKWKVELSPMQASANGEVLTVKGPGNEVSFKNVVVGDIWFCSGQSNMEWTVWNSNNRDAEIAAAKYPAIRLMTVPRNPQEKPVDTAAVKGWAECSPETVKNFSAAGYFFGRDIYKTVGVPVGLLASSYGGTIIESWMSGEVLKSDSRFNGAQERYEERLAKFPEAVKKWEADVAKWQNDSAAAARAGKNFTRREPSKPEGKGSRWLPASLYNGMIYPFLNAAIKGVIWYQGESNEFWPEEYKILFPAMVKQWRKDFRQEELPFFFVQIANHTRRNDPTKILWAYVREAQMSVLDLPMTGMVVTTDIGEEGNIHPKNKQEVGRRLALLAYAKVYGLGGEFSGPTAAGVKKEGSAFRISFKHAEGLNSKGEVKGFEVAGADKVYYPAKAKIEGETVVVSAAKVPEPVALRYDWSNTPPMPFFNGAGLPAWPFRTDNWPREKAE